MTRIIPNQNSWIGFSIAAPPALINSPPVALITGSTDLTCFCSTINASAQGNAIPTPDLCTLFEKTIVGTSTATFTADFYRDDGTDAAWLALPRNTKGIFFISRFGGTGASKKPQVGDKVEVWPVIVSSRAAGPLSSNTPQTFTISCAVYLEPGEAGVVVA